MSTASQKQLINALLGNSSDEALWAQAQVRDALAGSGFMDRIALGGGRGRFGWNGAIEMCRSKVEQRRRFVEGKYDLTGCSGRELCVFSE